MHKPDLNNLFPDCVVNINGKISAPQDATISIFDRGFLYGDSIYEVTYSEDRCLLFFKEHMDRLFNSARLLDLHMFMDFDEIRKEVIQTLKASNIDRAYIRIILTRGETVIGLDPSNSTQNNLVIIVKPQPKYPDVLYEKGYHLAIASVLRNDIKSTNPNAKSGNYLNNVMAMNEAKKLGADDAIMENHHGHITEGTTFNIWLVKDRVVYTPAVQSGLLKGITREKILTICENENIPCQESLITSDQILNADEVFITSSTKGIVPVSRLNDKSYSLAQSKTSVTSDLSRLYNKYVLEYKLKKLYVY